MRKIILLSVILCMYPTFSFAFQDPIVPWSEATFNTSVPKVGKVSIHIKTNYSDSPSWDNLWAWSKNPPVIESMYVEIEGEKINIPPEAFNDIQMPLLNSFEVSYILGYSIFQEGISIDFNFREEPYCVYPRQLGYARILISGGQVTNRMVDISCHATKAKLTNKYFVDKYPFKLFGDAPNNPYYLMQKGEVPKKEQIKFVLYNLKIALDLYKEKTGHYPTTEQGLEALNTKPSGEPLSDDYPYGQFFNLDKEIITYHKGNKLIPTTDPWGNKLIYESNGKQYKLFSYGADGKEGGNGINEDIYSEDV